MHLQKLKDNHRPAIRPWRPRLPTKYPTITGAAAMANNFWLHYGDEHRVNRKVRKSRFTALFKDLGEDIPEYTDDLAITFQKMKLVFNHSNSLS